MISKLKLLLLLVFLISCSLLSFLLSMMNPEAVILRLFGFVELDMSVGVLVVASFLVGGLSFWLIEKFLQLFKN